MKNIQTASKEEIAEIQWLRLKNQMLFLDKNSKFYHKRFKKNDIDLSEIHTLDDLRKIPITTKEELQLYNNDFICVPKEDIIDHVTTSGTLGRPVSLALNNADLDRLALNEMQSFQIIGVKKEDVVQITTTLDRRFMAGMAYFLGLRMLGAGVIRTGSGLPQLQWDSIERFQPKYLIAVPSFLLKMIDYAQEHHIDFKKSSVKAAICIGESIRNMDLEFNALSKKIKQLWDIELFSTYASSEMATAFTECELHVGNHAQPDLIFTEILDQAGAPVKPGEVGELVISTLQNTTMPLLRYATGDMVSFIDDPCKCGRNTIRLSPVIGRNRQMIKLKGTSLYPQNVIDTINEFDKISLFVIIAERGNLGIDNLIIKIPDTSTLTLIQLFKEFLKSKLQVTPTLEMALPSDIEKLKYPADGRKPRVFIDNRY